MGDHYVPKYYLRGFSPNFGQNLCVYDKQESKKFTTQVKSIANICGLYPAELEKYLAEEVEGPANKVLDKIRSHEGLTPKDKDVLSKYIGVMWKRVPTGIHRMKERLPGIAADLRKEYHQIFEEFAAINPSESESVDRLKSNFDEILDKYSVDPPAKIWHQNIPAARTPRMIEALMTMTWIFFTSDERPAFLTCDNPVFFFQGIGIGKADSELSFPITCHITLWASRRLDLHESYLPASRNVIKEMNRRVATNTTRYAFYANDEDWILPFLKKKDWPLNRII